ncbi:MULTISPECIES: acyltransferase family protein [Limnospira]|uniref:Acyl transferase (Membrane) n=1 Tax=Limnospira indica PCC 8005 TaxID=376219 RepID=A0A9P1KF50_9CYAN|nr:acyltransferase [Limnospira indica]EKD06198.1 hypothetical protein SPLC1_S541430 [Arthrospira platensis C1]QJB26742.1 acyltransferase [Limnospira fusiformis SAG 85.79]RAQ48852.1 acyltransferase [Arthrospira sp. O9.13F]UWU48905.1 Peptidoglycan/LPS O-acetylase OafA/YrhL, contains acyltransferase and SGNH-hydrolase domain [Arthrospira platensis C1]CDM95067.1 putative acyl transferase (membrane) [Limnospira indica PCC 8005]
MNKPTRLTGVDLFRGLAAFGVTVLHSRGGTTGAPDLVSSWLIISASFAVPFFLATSFYLSFNRFYSRGKLLNLGDRFQRLIIPYGFWSLIYVLSRIVKSLVLGNPQEAIGVIADPIAIIFMGASAVHLYFVPLLFFGSLSIKLIEFLENQKNQPSQKNRFLVLGVIISLILDMTLRFTNNSFRLGANVAFSGLTEQISWLSNDQVILRIFFVIIAWIIRCLPYVFIAAIVAKYDYYQNIISRKIPLIAGCSFLIFCVSTFGFLPINSMIPGGTSITEILQGYSSLILAIALSYLMKDNPIIQNLGACSFGIYLAHHLSIEIFEFIVKKISPGLLEPISATTILITAIFGFVTSWAIVNLCSRNQITSRLVL